MNTNSENSQIIGFDLGHGKTALAEVMSNNSFEPKIIEIQNEKFQMTAITYDEEGVAIIGDAAFEDAKYSQITSKKVKEFEISFKQRPDSQNEQKNIVNDFVQAVYLKLKEFGNLQNSIEQHFFIGCPSGWNKEEQNKYKQLMSEAGLPNVVIVPESRAAFMHALENKTLKIKEIREGILVIDIGSSTTDFTFVFDNKPEDLGEHEYDLGASLIEKEILQFAIEKHQNRKQIEKHFQINELDKKLWEIEVRRQVKERYFKIPDELRKKYNSCTKYREQLQPNIELEVKANQEIMEYIINKPLNELGGISWKKSFYNQLSIIQAKFNKKGIKPSKILLTGGGARMNFIREICQEIFPCTVDKSKDNEPELCKDNEPELCVARGLASWGRKCINTSQFEEDINQFISENLENIVKKHFDNYLDELANVLMEYLPDQVVKPSLEDLRNGKIKKKDLTSEIQQRAKKWLQLSYFKEQIIQKLIAEVKGIKK